MHSGHAALLERAIKESDRTVIIIAHRLSTILSSDRIVVINKGKIDGIGTHEELLSENKNYKTLYNIQFNNNKTS